ncbi:MAG TPA: PDZ domain-containing protein [Gemmatimonadaceae bacterium]|nr:PDZ domain-containing protein [Gemmatimonadaceae bacterium]
MRHSTFLAASLLALAAVAPLAAQDRAPADDEAPRTPRTRTTTAPADTRTLLGLALSYSGASRDTLGALVSAVVPDGPAERAGIDAGNRIAAINGVSLRVDAESIEEAGAGDAMLRRATRAISTIQPGDDVELRVFSGGRYRTVTVQTAQPGRATPVQEERPAAPAATAETTKSPESLATVVDAIAALQAQLRRLEQNQGTGPTLDSLTALEEDLGAIRRRVRALQTTPDRGGSSRPTASGDALPGLSVSTVADELVPVLGEGSESGLLVLKADDSWDPIRPGDVILRINGATATVERLRAARSSSRASTVDVLRRKREIAVVLDPGGQR